MGSIITIIVLVLLASAFTFGALRYNNKSKNPSKIITFVLAFIAGALWAELLISIF